MNTCVVFQLKKSSTLEKYTHFNKHFFHFITYAVIHQWSPQLVKFSFHWCVQNSTGRTNGLVQNGRKPVTPSTSIITYNIKTLRAKQDGCDFADAFSYLLYWIKIIAFKFNCNLSPKVQLMVWQHLVKWFIGAKQTTSHYLNQWLPSLFMYICVTLGLNDLSR